VPDVKAKMCTSNAHELQIAAYFDPGFEAENILREVLAYKKVLKTHILRKKLHAFYSVWGLRPKPRQKRRL